MFSESNEQSGTVGFLVGLIVLVFVGICFSRMVDKRFQFSSGKADMEQAIAEEKNQLEGLRHQAEVARKEFEAKSRPLRDQPAELEKMRLRVSTSSQHLRELREQQADLKNGIEAETRSFADYRATFRKQARQAAAGEKLAQLQAVGGKVYQEVTIRRVTPEGMEIAHSQGVSRLRPEDLGESWHQRFQWDDEENAGVVIVNAGKPAGKQPVMQAEEKPVLPSEKQAKEEVEKKLASLRHDVTETKRHLDRAELEVSRARSDSKANRGKSVPGSLDTWEERIAHLEAASEIFRSKYLDARGKLAAESPDDAVLRETSSLK